MANAKPIQTGRLRQELQRHRDSTDIYIEVDGKRMPVGSYEFTHRKPYIGPGIRDLVLRPHPTVEEKAVEPEPEPEPVAEPQVEQEPEVEVVDDEESDDEPEAAVVRKRGRPAKKDI